MVRGTALRRLLSQNAINSQTSSSSVQSLEEKLAALKALGHTSKRQNKNKLKIYNGNLSFVILDYNINPQTKQS